VLDRLGLVGVKPITPDARQRVSYGRRETTGELGVLGCLGGQLQHRPIGVRAQLLQLRRQRVGDEVERRQEVDAVVGKFERVKVGIDGVAALRAVDAGIAVVWSNPRFLLDAMDRLFHLARVTASRHLSERARVSASKARQHLPPLLLDLICRICRLGLRLFAEELQQLRAAVGMLRFFTVFASIWRIRSRVTPNARPISSRV
jgi:hypothetical protein